MTLEERAAILVSEAVIFGVPDYVELARLRKLIAQALRDERNDALEEAETMLNNGAQTWENAAKDCEYAGAYGAERILNTDARYARRFARDVASLKDTDPAQLKEGG